MAALFDYHGPAELLAAVREALAWVADPASGRSILAAGRVRQVRVDARGLRAVLALPPCPVVPVVLEDAQAELFDRLHGRLAVTVVCATPREGAAVSRRGSPRGCGCRVCSGR